jgi:hypothetical protein
MSNWFIGDMKVWRVARPDLGVGRIGAGYGRG